MRFLHKVLNTLDTDRIGVLEPNDFRWGLQSGKVFLNEEEANFLIKSYDCKGRVNYRQFLNDLRGKMNDNRYKSIIEAHKRVSKIIGGPTTLEEMGKIYDAKKHPEVLSGRKSEKDVFT